MPANAQFGVSLEAMPTKLYGGGTVYFTVKVLNYVNSVYLIRGYVVDEDGNKVYPEDGEYFEARNHTYTLYVDNYGGGESHTNSVKIEVKQGNRELQQVAFKCDDLYFDFRDYAYMATLSCRVYLYNPAQDSVMVKDIGVLNNYSLGDLEDVLVDSLSTGKWSIQPDSFSISPQETKIVQFSLPVEIGSWLPISGVDATEIVLKNGEYTTVEFIYMLGYSYDGNSLTHFSGEIYDTVKVKMDTKTIAADYILSGTAAIVDPNTVISFQLGSIRISSIRLSSKLSFDPLAFIWNAFIKPAILEHT